MKLRIDVRRMTIRSRMGDTCSNFWLDLKSWNSFFQTWTLKSDKVFMYIYCCSKHYTGIVMGKCMKTLPQSKFTFKWLKLVKSHKYQTILICRCKLRSFTHIDILASSSKPAIHSESLKCFNCFVLKMNSMISSIQIKSSLRTFLLLSQRTSTQKIRPLYYSFDFANEGFDLAVIQSICPVLFDNFHTIFHHIFKVYIPCTQGFLRDKIALKSSFLK